MNKVIIRGLEVTACHGVHAYEKTKPQRFIFDIDVYADFYGAAVRDDLNGTVNYSEVCNLVSSVACKNTFNLIETLAYSCVYAILDAFPASKVSITVRKPDAPVKHKFTDVGVTVEAERVKAFLSLGSSLGDRRKYLETAIEKLDSTKGIKVKKVSSVISTAPYGGVAENEFLNCAAEVETYLAPEELLKEVNRIEAECGRVRGKRWDDRTLDIDIIFYGKSVILSDNLVIPHPEYRKRDFVLLPLREIAPDFVCPVAKIKISDM